MKWCQARYSGKFEVVKCETKSTSIYISHANDRKQKHAHKSNLFFRSNAQLLSRVIRNSHQTTFASLEILLILVLIIMLNTG